MYILVLHSEKGISMNREMHDIAHEGEKIKLVYTRMFWGITEEK